MGAEYYEEEVSTVFVAGFALDSTTRELDNLCRFMPGFVNAKVDARKGKTLFARFDAQSSALSAISLLQGQAFDRSNPAEPMRAVLAKSNMKSDKPGMSHGGHAMVQYAIGGQPPPPTYPPVGAPQHGGPPVYGGPQGRRPRSQENPGEVDTVACVGAREQGYDDEAALHGFFASLPGFITFKPNPRMGGGFAKFDSPSSAVQAVSMAVQQGVPAEMAKSSMNGPYGGAGGAPAQPPPPSIPPPPGHGHGTKRPRMGENPNQVDTVASVGAAEQGIDEAGLQDFFSQIPGFVMFKANPRMGGGFAKFESPAHASEAVAIAQQQGVPCDIAKSSMSGPGGYSAAPVASYHQQPPPPSYAPPAKRHRAAENPGEVDTVAVVGAAEQGVDELALQSFFMEQPGFVAFKANPRMGGGFAKFESPELASQCVGVAQENGVPAEIAKSSMAWVN
eukprot:CAMPEP_0171283348 /NCGR_PEP_ID=MMETSP0790-20130122/67391_1 /TAXON_ID=2925 /ORGANISM="Alexandrium catenella, Strain OF101" /LENGTH=447 /DNA_ID=CAMNT_0011752639 /DNA_START=40 /DNA_END=1384 /DNA_ORIENTATION=+